jgi:hypothetical protein
MCNIQVKMAGSFAFTLQLVDAAACCFQADSKVEALGIQ